MEYPGLDVRNMSDDQLQKKIGELSSRVSRSNMRSDITAQLHRILNIMRTELNERTFKKSIETDKQWKPGLVLDTDDTVKDKDDLDKLINID